MLPVAMCDVSGCSRKAVVGFRRPIYISNSDSGAAEFIDGPITNCCEPHTAETARFYSLPTDIKVRFTD